MIIQSIGLKRLTVKLFPHDTRWKGAFELEARKLRKSFPHVEHIGSTAIKGIKAKPIIDILVCIPSMGRARDYVKPLKKMGFALRPFGSPNKHLLFVKGKESNRTHYLHLVKYDGQIWRNDVFFRDYLNKNKRAAKTYEKLKMELAEKFAWQRTRYTKAKWHFIKSILARGR